MSITRRSFFKAGLALPVAITSAHGAKSARGEYSSFDPWVEVNRGHLVHNAREIARRVDGRPIIAVIKNNGYGLGLVEVAESLESLQHVWGFAVVKLQEAVRLREAGIEKPILLMGPFTAEELQECIQRALTPMLYTDRGAELERLAQQHRRPISIHVCIDTGIGRVGVPFRDAERFVKELVQRKGVHIEGMMMTFTEDPELDLEQIKRFESVCTNLQRAGVDVGKKHAVSSFGLFEHPAAFFDMVRPGMALFGVYPEKKFRTTGIMDLHPAVALRCRVIYVKQLQPGDTAGYNRAYTAKHDVWMATLPVGHADGLPRVVAKGAKVRLGNSLYPIVAISASHCIVELGANASVRIGDVATVFDWESGSRPEDVSESCGASVYDLTMHLNPLLPRRIV